MELQRLRTFRTVATLMNLNQTAEILNYAQSTVSAQIKALEDEIGTYCSKESVKPFNSPRPEQKCSSTPQAFGHRGGGIGQSYRQKQGFRSADLEDAQTIATYYLPNILCAYQPRGADRYRCDLDWPEYLRIHNTFRTRPRFSTLNFRSPLDCGDMSSQWASGS
jgi:hypothetical protein